MLTHSATRELVNIAGAQAEITKLQSLKDKLSAAKDTYWMLIDRFVEHREAVADGENERVKTLEAEIDSFLREKTEIEKWATVGSA
jgi:hypothetical protein